MKITRKIIKGLTSDTYCEMLELRANLNGAFARAIDKDRQSGFYFIDTDGIAETRKCMEAIEKFLRELEREFAK